MDLCVRSEHFIHFRAAHAAGLHLETDVAVESDARHTGTRAEASSHPAGPCGSALLHRTETRRLTCLTLTRKVLRDPLQALPHVMYAVI